MINPASFEEIRNEFRPAPEDPVRITEGVTRRLWFTYGDRGCISLLPIGDHKYRVGGWFVKPEHRGKGVGIFLLRHVMLQGDRLRSRLEMRTKSTAPAVCGWEKTGREFRYGGVEWGWTPPIVERLST